MSKQITFDVFSFSTSRMASHLDNTRPDVSDPETITPSSRTQVPVVVARVVGPEQGHIVHYR